VENVSEENRRGCFEGLTHFYRLFDGVNPRRRLLRLFFALRGFVLALSAVPSVRFALSKYAALVFLRLRSLAGSKKSFFTEKIIDLITRHKS